MPPHRLSEENASKRPCCGPGGHGGDGSAGGSGNGRAATEQDSYRGTIGINHLTWDKGSGAGSVAHL